MLFLYRFVLKMTHFHFCLYNKPLLKLVIHAQHYRYHYALILHKIKIKTWKDYIRNKLNWNIFDRRCCAVNKYNNFPIGNIIMIINNIRYDTKVVECLISINLNFIDFPRILEKILATGKYREYWSVV